MSSPFARRESASRSSPPPTAATRARASSDVEHSLIDWEQLFETGSVHNQASREQSDALVRDRTRRRATAIILDVEERRIKGAKKPTARSDAAAASVMSSGETVAIVEGGSPEYYSLWLSSRPVRPVTITVVFMGLSSKLTVSPTLITLDPENWDVPQRIRVMAADGMVVEGDDSLLISHRVNSVDRSYAELGFEAIPEIAVRIVDKNATFVWSMGEGVTGALGHGNLRHQAVPTLIPSMHDEAAEEIGKKVSSLSFKVAAAGYGHSAVVTNTGSLYVWGTGTEGQLGLGKDIIKQNKAIVMLPRRLDALAHHHVTMVDCGKAHTVFGTREGAIYTMGANSDGQLGVGKMPRIAYEPVEVTALKDEHVIAVACGGRHTLCLTRDYEVFSWGCNKGGQLGFVSEGGITAPGRVTLPEGIKVGQITSGENHSALVSTDARLMTWGWGEDGRLGLGDEITRRIPQFVKCGVVCTAKCGGGHTAALVSGGDVLTWGQGNFGQLGHGDTQTLHRPRCVRMLKSKGVCSLSLGCWHTACVTHDGVLYSFGFSFAFGLDDKKVVQDGLGAELVQERASLPRISATLLGAHTISVACGRIHTLVMSSTKSNAQVDPDNLVRTSVRKMTCCCPHRIALSHHARMVQLDRPGLPRRTAYDTLVHSDSN